MLSLSSPQLLSSTIHWSCNPPCRRAAEAFNQRRLQRRFRATLRAWREVAAARRYLRAQGAHAECLLERRMLGRVVGGWRRAALAGKLCHTLEVVRQHMPKAHIATVYAKPKGRPMVDTFITEVSQDTWIFFPWDMALQYVEPYRGGD